ncbi:MAG: ribonuclease Z [Candidatus Aenigmatarchaeota archaeon]
MIKITILGSGSSIPTFDRWHPSVALELFYDKYFLILLDCGEGTQLRLMQSKISFMRISHILITHWHADHFAGLIPLLQSMQLEGRKEKLYLIAPEASKMFENIKNLYYYKLKFPVETIDAEEKVIFENEYFSISALEVIHTVKAFAYKIEEKEKWKINEEKLKALGLKRGKWLNILKEKGKYEINGKIVKLEEVADLVKGKKIVYTGDTEYCEKLVEFSKDADILIHDSTYLEKDKEKTMHSSALDAAKIAKQANVKTLVLTHFSRRYQKEEDFKEFEREVRSIFNGNLIIAKDLLSFEIK